MRTEQPRGHLPRREIGSVLMLMPVAVLVVLLLGAISIDAAVRFQAQREAVADAQSIAHDVASAVSGDALRFDGVPTGDRLDPAEVQHRIATDVQARRLRGSVRWRIDGQTVVVTVVRSTPLMFSGVVPGDANRSVVQGRATAVLTEQHHDP